MSWNESGNQQDPWGKPGQKKPEQEQQHSGQEKEPNKQSNEQQPPDLEEVFNSLLKKWVAVKAMAQTKITVRPFPQENFYPHYLD